MKYDMGVCSGNPHQGYVPIWKHREFVIFALTPGIPHEWVNNVLQIPPRTPRIKLRRVAWKLRPELEHLAIENAATITVEDGCAMIRAIKRPYNGPMPYWSTLALMTRRQTERSKDLAAEFGVHPVTMSSEWLKHKCYNPLTLQRIQNSLAQKHYRAEDFTTLRAEGPLLSWEICARMNGFNWKRPQ